MMPNSEEKYPTLWNVFVANFVLFQVHYSLVSIISHIGKKAYGGKLWNTCHCTPFWGSTTWTMSLLSRPLHLWGTLPWGWPRWRDGLLAHLWRWKSQQDDQWGCVPLPAEVSLLAILPETGVEESDLWLRDLAQKRKNGGKCWCSVWKKNGHHLSAIYS